MKCGLIWAALITSGLIFFADVARAEFSARVISILDGDTLEVLYNKSPKRILLNGIDCPEKRQAHGQKAKHATSALVFGKAVTLHTFGKDKYGRTIADVVLPDGFNMNQELVKQGWCWWYRKYAPGNTDIAPLNASRFHVRVSSKGED